MHRYRLIEAREESRARQRRMVREFCTLVMFFGTVYLTAVYAHALAG